MKLDIVIPSKNRKAKLDHCLNSIFHAMKDISNHEINIHLYFSTAQEYEYYKSYFQGFEYIHIKYIPTYRVPNFWNEHLNTMSADAMMYINDDIEFFEDCISVVLEEFSKKFPTHDGVMGIRQDNLPQDQAVEGAFGVIGKAYTANFPEGTVWCLDYDRFYSDFELWQYSSSIGKFYYCSIARIKHYHPAFDKKQIDSTHDEVRTYLPKDRLTFNQRKEKGLLWGKSFSLINF